MAPLRAQGGKPGGYPWIGTRVGKSALVVGRAEELADARHQFRRCVVKEHVRHLVKRRAGAVDAVELRTRASEAADRDPPSLLDVRLRIAERSVEIEEPMVFHGHVIIPKPKAGRAKAHPAIGRPGAEARVAAHSKNAVSPLHPPSAPQTCPRLSAEEP